MSRGLLRTISRWFLGTGREVPLIATHCVHSVAEAFFAVSMAGSIFFSVSPDAARPRVLLFLVVTLAPFLVMAPLVGPVVDRLRGGLAATMVATFVLRAVLAVSMAEHLRGVLLFPLAFGLLVTAKTYTVSRNGLVPSVVDDEIDLVGVNARISRTATITGALGASLAFACYTATSAAWTLRVAAVLYVVGAVVAWRVRAATSGRMQPLDQDALVELDRPDVSGAVWDMMVLRAATGFSLFQFGFSLRSDGEPAWVLGAVLVGNSTGAFVGTVVSPWLRSRTSERTMFTAALCASAMAMALCGLVFNRLTLLVAIMVLGGSVSVGRRALDATIQRQAPHARRGQVYAGIETRLELVWVAAACMAVALRVASWVGVLPERLLMRAESLAEHGFHDEAIVVAGLAADAAAGEGPASEPDLDLARRAQVAIEQARRRIDSG
jgi:hypothetical protein